MYFNTYNEKIIYVGKNDPYSLFSCMLAGVTYKNPNYRIVRNNCDVYVFEYVVSGKWSIEVGDRVYDVHEGMFYCLEKGVDEVHYASQDEPYEKMWINLDGELVRKIFSFFNLSTLYVAEVNVMNIFIEIHDKLEHIDDTNESETYAEIMSLLFNMLVAATRERFFPSTSNNTSVDEKIRAYIDKNIYNDITLDDIASEFGITKMHVIRLFKQRYNITPIQYILDKKISISKSLLTGTLMPIKEIASLLNYSNTQHFSGAFKKAVGCTPNKYRQAK